MFITYWKLSLEIYPPLENAQNHMMTTMAAPMYKPVPFATGAGACAAPILTTNYRGDQSVNKNENT